MEVGKLCSEYRRTADESQHCNRMKANKVKRKGDSWCKQDKIARNMTIEDRDTCDIRQQGN